MKKVNEKIKWKRKKYLIEAKENKKGRKQELMLQKRKQMLRCYP